MGAIDIGIIVIVSFFALVGFAKGFLSSLVSLFGGALTLVLAILVCKPVAAFIDKVSQLSVHMSAWIRDGLNDLTGGVLDVTFNSETVISTLLNDLPVILKSIAQDILDKAIASAAITEGVNILSYMTEILTGIAMILVGVIVAFILIKIAVVILSKIFDVVTRNRSISGLDKLLGLVFGLTKGAIIIAVACVGVYIAKMTPFAAGVTAEIAKNPIASYVYDTADNYITDLVDMALDKVDFNEIVANLFGIETEPEV